MLRTSKYQVFFFLMEILVVTGDAVDTSFLVLFGAVNMDAVNADTVNTDTVDANVVNADFATVDADVSFFFGASSFLDLFLAVDADADAVDADTDAINANFSADTVAIDAAAAVVVLVLACGEVADAAASLGAPVGTVDDAASCTFDLCCSFLRLLAREWFFFGILFAVILFVFLCCCCSFFYSLCCFVSLVFLYLLVFLCTDWEIVFLANFKGPTNR